MYANRSSCRCFSYSCISWFDERCFPIGHICPKCFESAPLLFGFCPECNYDLKDCIKNGCDHCWSTRDDMMKNSGHLENPLDNES